MSGAYYTYRVRIANPERVQVEKRDLQGNSLGEPNGAFGYQGPLRQQIDALIQAARDDELRDTRQVKELGEALFKALFDDALCHDFVTFYNQAVHVEDKLLRVELDVDEHELPEVAALPWEFMRLPTSANLGTIWLGTAPNLIFSRRRAQWYVPQPIQLEPAEKLKVALTVAAPSDLTPVAYERMWAALEKLAQEQADRIELMPLVNPATPETLDDTLARDPHVFHFIGHGRLLEGQRQAGQIALVDELGEAMWVEADYFSDLLNQHRPGVVFLQACEGGRLSASQAFVGVASRVVQQNIPVVLAMQYPVSNSTASRFARRFYQRLAQDDPVDRAAQDGRRRIALGPKQYEARDFATPVLFMRVPDGHLFQRAGVPAQESTPARPKASQAEEAPPVPFDPNKEIHLPDLYRQIDDHFDEKDLRDLCFDLGIDYETLPAKGKGGKARELVLYCKRRNRVLALRKRCHALRPTIEW